MNFHWRIDGYPACCSPMRDRVPEGADPNDLDLYEVGPCSVPQEAVQDLQDLVDRWNVQHPQNAARIVPGGCPASIGQGFADPLVVPEGTRIMLLNRGWMVVADRGAITNTNSTDGPFRGSLPYPHGAAIRSWGRSPPIGIRTACG